MTTEQAMERLTEVIRRKHLALSTEHSYVAWLKRYCHFIKGLPVNLRSEQKLEQFLTALAKDDVAASTQNQAFNAILFFYREAMGMDLKKVNALRAKRPEHLRHAPTREETTKYPQSQFDWNWAWVFPANETCVDPRTGKIVRWRLHEAKVQRAVRKACRLNGVAILPHELRHAYATHCLSGGANPRAIQQVMGHKSLETTMDYLHVEAEALASPLDH